jgi:hypothetical protein
MSKAYSRFCPTSKAAEVKRDVGREPPRRLYLDGTFTRTTGMDRAAPEGPGIARASGR